MDPVYATAAYCRATLITPHDYLRTMGNLKTVKGASAAGLSNKGRESRLSSVSCKYCIEAHSRTLAQSGRPRWTHKHRRFANLSVFPSKTSSTSQILLNYITDLHRHLHRGDITILIYIAPVARRIKYATFPSSNSTWGNNRRNQLPRARAERGPV